MALTSEQITQASFKTKFRGFDSREVTDFLELVAARLDELELQLKEQSEKIVKQVKELELAADDKKSFEDVIEVYRKNIETLKDEQGETDQRLLRLGEELKQQRGSNEVLQRERDRLKAELGQVHTSLSEAESKSRMSGTALEELRKKVVALEAEKTDLHTSAERAQKALDDHLEQARDLIEKSRQQADRIVTAAREEVDQLRSQASFELVQLREDIGRLTAQRRQLHQDLRNVLETHLTGLEDLPAASVDTDRSEYDDLFQKIDFTELAEFEETEEGQEILNQKLTESEDSEVDDERFKSTLKDGGIAYLSDE